MHVPPTVLKGSQRARSLGRKLERSLKRRGVAGTLQFCILNIPSFLMELTPARRRAKSSQSEFDRKFHVDTSGQIDLSELHIESPNSVFGNSYQPTSPKMFLEMLGAIDIRHEEYTFIDLGSGKGLVLLLASTYPFRKIIGVEFSPQLHRIAEDNIRHYHNPAQQCRNIKSVLGDVAEYPIPEEPEVLYLFNPFNEKIVDSLVANIRRSVEAHPRPLFVLYKNPVANGIFERERFLKVIKLTKQYAIYSCKGPGAQY